MHDHLKWLEGLATADLDEGAADGVTVGMVYQQEAERVQIPRLTKDLDALLKTLWAIALYPSGGTITAGTPDHDKHMMLHNARETLCNFYKAYTWRQCVEKYKPVDTSA